MVRTAMLIIEACFWVVCCAIVWITLTPVAALVVAGAQSKLGTGGSVLLFFVAVMWLRRQERARC